MVSDDTLQTADDFAAECIGELLTERMLASIAALATMRDLAVAKATSKQEDSIWESMHKERDREHEEMKELNDIASA